MNKLMQQKPQLLKVVKATDRKQATGNRASEMLDRVDPDFRSAITISSYPNTSVQVSLIFRNDCPEKVNAHLTVDAGSWHQFQSPIPAPTGSGREIFEPDCREAVGFDDALKYAKEQSRRIFEDIWRRLGENRDVCSIEIVLTFKKGRLHARREVLNSLFIEV